MDPIDLDYDVLAEALRASWGADTSEADDWSADTPERGQGPATAAVVDALLNVSSALRRTTYTVLVEETTGRWLNRGREGDLLSFAEPGAPVLVAKDAGPHTPGATAWDLYDDALASWVVSRARRRYVALYDRVVAHLGPAFLPEPAVSGRAPLMVEVVLEEWIRDDASPLVDQTPVVSLDVAPLLDTVPARLVVATRRGELGDPELDDLLWYSSAEYWRCAHRGPFTLHWPTDGSVQAWLTNSLERIARGNPTRLARAEALLPTWQGTFDELATCLDAIEEV